MLTTKTRLEPEPYWVPICNAYSLLHHRIVNALSKFALCIPQENAPSPFGIVISDGNSNEMIVNYNGSDMLLIVSKIDIYNSDMKHTLHSASKWWQLESTIGSMLRDYSYYCDVEGLGVLVCMLHNILKAEFLDAPKNKIVHAYGRIGSKWAPFSLIASDNWEIDRVDFELNEVVLRGGETIYSVHFCPTDRRRVFDLHQRHAQAIGDVLQAAVSAAHGAPEPQQRRRGKGRPALERTQGIIKELYPDGVPGQASEPNASLCRQVSVKLKEAKLPDVSDDTILRAAGRRK